MTDHDSNNSPRREPGLQEGSATGKTTMPDQDFASVVETQPAGQDSMKGSPAVLATPEPGADFATVVEAPTTEPIAGTPPLEPSDGKPADLHSRGVRLIAEGKPEEAILLLRRVVELKPGFPDYHHNLGVAYANAHRLEEAVASFREAQRIKPEGTSAYSNMGLALAQQGKTAEAAAAFKECLRLDPQAVDVLHRFANMLRSAKRPAEGLPHLQEALRLRPDSADLHHSLGLTFADLGKPNEAIDAYRKVLHFNPKHADALNNLGIVLQNTGKSEEAVDCYKKALRIRPHSSETFNNLGVALAALERHDDAIMAYRSALQLSPKSAGAYSNLGNAFRHVGLIEDSLAALDEALKLSPKYPEGHNNRAVALMQAGEPEAAVASYDRAIDLKPEYADAYLNRALARLLVNDYEGGLEDYEWRWKRPGRAMPDWGRPLWDGTDPVGRTILMWGEQGLGDSIQFCRYAAVLARRGATPLLCVPEPLVRLARTVPGVFKASSSSDKLPPFSAHAPLMSFPRLMAMRSLDEAPAPVPYVSAGRAAAASCREHVRAGSEWVVGVVWRGNAKYAGDKIRSIQPELVTPLSKIPGIRLVSLMKEAVAGECALAGAVDIGAGAWADFADSAAAFVNLDLVISVDTAAAHLAGALGIPLWLALPSAPDMRWGLGREDSPWYPTARLFRQLKRGEWQPVFERIAEELGILVKRGLRPGTAVGKSSTAEALHGRGLALLRDHDRAKAIGFLEEAVRLQPKSGPMRLNLGVALAQAGRIDDALREFRKNVEVDPDSPLGHANLGLACVQSGRYDEALRVLGTAVRLDPKNADVHNHLGIAQAQLGHEEEATSSYAQAIQLRPEHHAAHVNRGNLLRSQGRLEEALASYEEALRRCPTDPEVYNNRAIAYDGLSETTRALADYDQALALDPAHAETRFNRALALLLGGDYQSGLEEYEWRWRRPGHAMPDKGAPLWDGVIIPGQRLLIWAEQGLGDVLHCCRFAPLLAERGLQVFLEVPASLVQLLRSLKGLAGVVRSGEKISDLDAQVPMMSLPRLWPVKRPEDVPGPVPYLTAEVAAARACRDRVRAEAPLVVGIAWRGNPNFAGDSARSVRPGMFSPIAKIPGVRLVNLGKEASSAECADAGAADIGALKWTDFAEAAAALVNLDLVISVDTAVVHLAGSLGVPVWIALPSAPDWRWGLSRMDSPWYPTARIFRQENRADWKPVFERIASELARFAARKVST